jgi:hypothetical protein
VRTNDILRRPAFDHTGRPLGAVVDLVAELDPAGIPRVVAVVVNPHWHTRLLGYERPQAHGPWLVERLARVLRRGTRTVPWAEVRLGERPAG